MKKRIPDNEIVRTEMYVDCCQYIGKTVLCDVYSECEYSEDEDGIGCEVKDPNSEQLFDAWNDAHYTPMELIKQLSRMSQVLLDHYENLNIEYLFTKEKLQNLVEECEGWEMREDAYEC